MSENDLLRQLAVSPPTNCHVEHIDFTAVGLPEYEGKFAILIHNLFTLEECSALLQTAEATSNAGWEEALINVGGGRQRLITDARLCKRIMWDAPAVAEMLAARIKPHLPEDMVTLVNKGYITGHGPVKRKETWEMSRLNERLRFLKYTKGMYFREHCDGCFVTPDGTEHSNLTVHIYLNSQSGAETDGSGQVGGGDRTEQKPLKGGATRFLSFQGGHYDVNPTMGTCLVFQQRSLLHSGEEVEEGTKYTMRTDIMFKKIDKTEA